MGETVRMASLYSALFICVCISLLLHSHVAKYYTTTAYASRENSKRTDFITSHVTATHELMNSPRFHHELGRKIFVQTLGQKSTVLSTVNSIPPLNCNGLCCPPHSSPCSCQMNSHCHSCIQHIVLDGEFIHTFVLKLKEEHSHCIYYGNEAEMRHLEFDRQDHQFDLILASHRREEVQALNNKY